jgi:hypothetical protein
VFTRREVDELWERGAGSQLREHFDRLADAAIEALRGAR